MKTQSESIIIATAIHDWLGSYLPDVRANSTNTLKAYREALTLYVRFLEDEKSVKPINLSSGCFSRSYIQSWMIWLKDKRHSSNSTRNHRLVCLRSFIKYLSRKNIMFVQIEAEAYEIKTMRSPKKGMDEITKDAMKALFAAPNLNTAIGKRDFALFNLIYNTATRIDEILSLIISSLHLEGKRKDYITVWGKGIKRRTLFILPEVAKIIKAYIKEFHGSAPNTADFLFFSHHGGGKKKLTQAAVDKRLKLYASIANKKCADLPKNLHCHCLRHARATHWLDEGLNIVMIQKLLGHEDIKTTMGYVGVSTEQKAKALETIEDDITKKMAKKWKSVKKTDSLVGFLGLK
jgi:integrase/recombinase XerD